MSAVPPQPQPTEEGRVPILLSMATLPPTFLACLDPIVPLTAHPTMGLAPPPVSPSVISHPAQVRPACQTCALSFPSVTLQRQHFRDPWHTYNMRSLVDGRPTVFSGTFELLTPHELMHGISPSDTEEDSSDATDDPQEGTRPVGSPYLWYTSSAHPTLKFGLWKCVLKEDGRKRYANHPHQPLVLPAAPSIKAAFQAPWAMLALTGGYFAGVIVDPTTQATLQHKTFRRYTTRRKQGGSQLLFDKRSGRAARSAGASLRRANEIALIEEILGLLQRWKSHLAACSRIFIKVPAWQRPVLISDATSAPFSKDDPRIRSIPFRSGRPSLKEMAHILQELVRVRVAKVVVDPLDVLGLPDDEEVFGLRTEEDSEEEDISSPHPDLTPEEGTDPSSDVEAAMPEDITEEDWEEKEIRVKDLVHAGMYESLADASFLSATQGSALSAQSKKARKRRKKKTAPAATAGPLPASPPEAPGPPRKASAIEEWVSWMWKTSAPSS